MTGRRPSLVRIVADIHEERSGIPSFLRRLGAAVQIASLPIGDYVVGDGTIVERKTVLHLHSATVNGVFWAQLGRLRVGCRVPFLLIEGSDFYRGPLRAESVRGLYLAVLDCGVRIVRSHGREDSARWLLRLAHRRQRTRITHDRPPYAQRPTMTKYGTPAEAVLASVPEISTVTARRLLARFGSVAGVIEAGPEAWTAIRGIGPERARRLAETLGVE